MQTLLASVNQRRAHRRRSHVKTDRGAVHDELNESP